MSCFLARRDGRVAEVEPICRRERSVSLQAKSRAKSRELFKGRRDGRVAEGARLESVYTLTGIVCSNPTLSARFFLDSARCCRNIGAHCFIRNDRHPAKLVEDAGKTELTPRGSACPTMLAKL